MVRNVHIVEYCLCQDYFPLEIYGHFTIPNGRIKSHFINNIAMASEEDNAKRWRPFTGSTEVSSRKQASM